jgi:hypothetical protein
MVYASLGDLFIFLYTIERMYTRLMLSILLYINEIGSSNFVLYFVRIRLKVM